MAQTKCTLMNILAVWPPLGKSVNSFGNTDAYQMHAFKSFSIDTKLGIYDNYCRSIIQINGNA